MGAYNLLLWISVSEKVNQIHEKSVVDECLYLMSIV